MIILYMSDADGEIVNNFAKYNDIDKMIDLRSVISFKNL